MADGSELRSVADALAEVARWRADEEARHSTELAEVDQEVASLQTGIENLKQQLEALGRFRTELLGKVDTIDSTVAGRNYSAVFEALALQREQLGARAEELLQKERVRDAQLEQTLNEPDVRSLLTEYEQYRNTIEPTLVTLPPTYRSAMEELGRKQKKELSNRLGGLGTEPIASDGPSIAVDVLIAVDAPDGQAEVLMLVMPVADSVHSQWSERDEDLQTRLAARVMQGVFSTAKNMGLAGNQGIFGGHKGQLAVEVELAGGAPAEIGEAFRNSVQQALDAAPEVQAGQITATARLIEVDYLLPPEDSEMAEVSA